MVLLVCIVCCQSTPISQAGRLSRAGSVVSINKNSNINTNRNVDINRLVELIRNQLIAIQSIQRATALVPSDAEKSKDSISEKMADKDADSLLVPESADDELSVPETVQTEEVADSKFLIETSKAEVEKTPSSVQEFIDEAQLDA